MNQPLAICPQCRKEVAFVTTGAVRRCPQCGFQFEVSAAPPVLEPSPGSEVMSVVRVLLICLGVMGALVVVAVGVVFAGCALMMRH
jgi:predicted amidophosphoribosyltransferase